MSSHIPTDQQLGEARQALHQQQKSSDEVAARIQEARQKLEEVIRQSEMTIDALNREKSEIEKQIQTTKEFLSPMRRLPDDILRQIFWQCFDLSAHAGWRLAAVCSSWRRIALDMPRLWAKIRLVTATHESPEIIRIWLERSKSLVPLDIEIFLEVPPNQRRRRQPPSPTVPWSPPIEGWFNEPPPTPPIPLLHPTVQTSGTTSVKLGMQDEIPHLQTHQMATMPYVAHYADHNAASCSSNVPHQSAANVSWAHIVFFYLTMQMHRWKRFVFRFERKFDSIKALQALNGHEAPLLEEFEISSGEIMHLRPETDFSPFDLLPNGSSKTHFPQLRAVTLRYIPFKWNSPLVSGNLRSLHIQTTVAPIGPQSSQITLDRVLNALTANPLLENLSLSFQAIHPSLLPLAVVSLPALRTLYMTGNLIISKLLESLSAPALESLTLNMDCEALDDTILQFMQRSQQPPVHTLSLAYETPTMFGMDVFYPHGVDDGEVARWHFFSALPQLRTLKVGRTNMETLLDALKHRGGSWPLPQLEHLAMRTCSSTSNTTTVPKLLNVVNERNPPLNGAPADPIPALIHTLPPLPLHPAHHPHWGPPFPPNFGGFVEFTPSPPSTPEPQILHPTATGAPLDGGVDVGGATQFDRLRSLELYDCLPLSDNVLNHLRSRIDDVKHSKPHRYGYGCTPLTIHY